MTAVQRSCSRSRKTFIWRTSPSIASRDRKSQVQGFYTPYAARLERVDACFGEFIAYLKDAGLYESSIVVLTSDHGDSLGDEGRWGHAYTVFPEVMRVPLIMHVPCASA